MKQVIHKVFMILLPSDLKQSKPKNGFVILLSVLVMGAVGLSIALYLLSAGLVFSKSSFNLEQSGQAKFLANTCVEDALFKISACTSTIGNYSLNLTEGNCTYTISKPSEETRTITSQGNVDNVIRKVKLEVDSLVPVISVKTWQEVASF